jgi:hypothetical protein
MPLNNNKTKTGEKFSSSIRQHVQRRRDRNKTHELFAIKYSESLGLINSIRRLSVNRSIQTSKWGSEYNLTAFPDARLISSN